VAELTGMLVLSSWPKGMRFIVRRERRLTRLQTFWNNMSYELRMYFPQRSFPVADFESVLSLLNLPVRRHDDLEWCIDAGTNVWVGITDQNPLSLCAPEGTRWLATIDTAVKRTLVAWIAQFAIPYVTLMFIDGTSVHDCQIEVHDLGTFTTPEAWKDFARGRCGSNFDLPFRSDLTSWFECAAKVGVPNSMVNLSLLLIERQGRWLEAETWFRKAIEAGNASGMIYLGQLLEQWGQQEKADQWFQRTAREGKINAATQNPRIPRTGHRQKVEQWFRRTANAGDIKAMTNLGLLLHESGHGEEAEQWFRRAAEAGDPNAMYNLRIFAETRRSSEAK
jgi:hypothetical protein